MMLRRIWLHVSSVHSLLPNIPRLYKTDETITKFVEMTLLESAPTTHELPEKIAKLTAEVSYLSIRFVTIL